MAKFPVATDDGFNIFRDTDKVMKTKVDKSMRFARRRALLKKGKNPLVMASRAWKKASTWGKVGIGASIIIPKALILGFAYGGAKSISKSKKAKEQKTMPGKYYIG